MIEPQSYWEDRAKETEEALHRVCWLLSIHLPALGRDLTGVMQEWRDVRKQIDLTWQESKTDATTDNTPGVKT